MWSPAPGRPAGLPACLASRLADWTEGKPAEQALHVPILISKAPIERLVGRLVACSIACLSVHLSHCFDQRARPHFSTPHCSSRISVRKAVSLALLADLSYLVLVARNPTRFLRGSRGAFCEIHRAASAVSINCCLLSKLDVVYLVVRLRRVSVSF